MTRTAVVTGASRGIGRTVAQQLAATRTVVALARSEPPLRALADECGVIPVTADVADPDSVLEAWAQIQDVVGTPDLIVNNAASSDAGEYSWDQQPDSWWHVFETNVRSIHLLSSLAVPGMLARGSGRIANIVSNAAFFPVWQGLGDDGPAPASSAYMASKAAVVRLTEVMAGETRGSGVTLFAISPGMVKTEMTAAVPMFQDWWDEPDVWNDADATADLLEFLDTGALDALSGRYLHAVSDDWRSLAEHVDDAIASDHHTLRLRAP